MLGYASLEGPFLQSVRRYICRQLMIEIRRFTFAIAFSSTSNSGRPVDLSVATSLKISSTCRSLIFRHISWLPVNTYRINSSNAHYNDAYVRTVLSDRF